jgi:hypothetical protein
LAGEEGVMMIPFGMEGKDMVVVADEIEDEWECV